MDTEQKTQYSTILKPFDPSVCGGNTKQEFEKFIRLYEFKYLASDRKVPSAETDGEGWIQKDMWRQLMGNYATDGFLDDIMAVSPDPKKQTFDAMVKLLLARYAPTQNITMSHFNFHRSYQRPGQSFDDFVNELKRL